MISRRRVLTVALVVAAVLAGQLYPMVWQGAAAVAANGAGEAGEVGGLLGNVTPGSVEVYKKALYQSPALPPQNKQERLAAEVGQFLHVLYHERQQADYLDLLERHLPRHRFFGAYLGQIEGFIDPVRHSSASIQGFFSRHQPKTERGKILAAALGKKRMDKAKWRNASLPLATERFLLGSGVVTAAEVDTKVEQLLWLQQRDKAAELVQLLPKGMQAERRRRLRLLGGIAAGQSGAQGINGNNWAGLQRFYRIRRQLKDEPRVAIDGLLQRPVVGRNWWPIIQIAAREAMLLGDWRSAHRLLVGYKVEPRDMKSGVVGANGMQEDYRWLRGFSGFKSRGGDLDQTQVIADLTAAMKAATNPGTQARAAFWLSAAYQRQAKHWKKAATVVGQSERQRDKIGGLSAMVSEGKAKVAASVKATTAAEEAAKKAAKYLRIAAMTGPNFYSYHAAAVLCQQNKNDEVCRKRKAAYQGKGLKQRTIPAFAVRQGQYDLSQPGIAEALFMADLFWQAKHYGEVDRLMIWLVGQDLNPKAIQQIAERLVAKKNYTLLVKMSNRLQTNGYGAILASFPQPYVLPAERQNPPSLYYAIIRQESEFNHQAISKAAAIGPMQIRAKFAKNEDEMLAEYRAGRIEKGLAYGVMHLDQLVESFSGSIPAAIAAYNAGQGAIMRWDGGRWVTEMSAAQDVMEILTLVETCPYRETREYVKRVLANYYTYMAMSTGREPNLSGLLQRQ